MHIPMTNFLFSFCTSTFLCIIHWFNWQSTKQKFFRKIHTTKPNKRKSFVANRVWGMKSGRAVGCFRERMESPKWKQRMKVETFGLVPVAVFLFFGWLYTYL
jgi:hypothetical protein